MTIGGRASTSGGNNEEICHQPKANKPIFTPGKKKKKKKWVDQGVFLDLSWTFLMFFC